jgi:phytol kinase
MFPDATISRWLAALIPLLITVQFALVGLGVIKDEASVQAMSRTGDRREILRGPLFYGIMFVVLTIVYWKDSPIGIAALMMMCGGDGIADIVGRRVKSPKLAWSREKSFAGLVSVFVGGWLMTLFVIVVYIWAGVFAAPFIAYLLPVTLIALGGTLVESLPFKDIDNITLTVVSAIIGHLAF